MAALSAIFASSHAVKFNFCGPKPEEDGNETLSFGF
jgi:hypothetical protein